MWLANNKRQPCFYPPSSHTQEDTKTDKPDGKPVLCQRTFSSVFRAIFLNSQTAQFNLECMGPLRIRQQHQAAMLLLSLVTALSVTPAPTPKRKHGISPKELKATHFFQHEGNMITV